ncbi:hypothetical protein HDK77DRAFT_454199 [Phyllosticta capitalensis]
MRRLLIAALLSRCHSRSITRGGCWCCWCWCAGGLPASNSWLQLPTCDGHDSTVCDSDLSKGRRISDILPPAPAPFEFLSRPRRRLFPSPLLSPLTTLPLIFSQVCHQLFGLRVGEVLEIAAEPFHPRLTVLRLGLLGGRHDGVKASWVCRLLKSLREFVRRW